MQHRLQAVCLLLPAYDSDRIVEPQVVVDPLARDDEGNTGAAASLTCPPAIGGEWFLMWQSTLWNSQQAAFRFVAILGIILVYLVMPDTDDTA